ncbi:STAS/SEC14 domain-containing protein [Pontibacter sp. H249]|uniref:STAS/SEC14 domain-containing protein n=1 Tax=Pontibacter sp. H249 TaxID=3133420 RepID=UPI0030C4AF65
MKKLYYESAELRLSVDKEKRIGMAEWRGFLSSEEFRNNGLRCLHLIQAEGLVRWLADQRVMRAIRQQDLNWVVTELVPLMLASPLRRMAIVVSVDIFNNMAMEQLFKRAGNLGDLIIKEFDNEDAALQWLLQPIPKKAEL